MVQPHRVVQCDAREYRNTKPMIVEKRAKALLAVARADPRQMLYRECESDGKPEMIDDAHADSNADQRHRAEINRVAQRNRDDVETAERQRGRADADVDVIVAVDHRVI